VQQAAVSQVRATSARVAFASPSCVTATFSYAKVGQPPSQIGGGPRCSRSHSLLLGLLTAPLQPGSLYRVTIQATDAYGSTTSQTLTFTTLG
jgi:hypothetical protein